MAGHSGGPWGGGGSGGGGDNRGDDPRGGNRRPGEGPQIPELDQIMKKGQEQLRVLMGGRGTGSGGPRHLLDRHDLGNLADDALALISDLSLGLFLIMALMGLQVWELNGVLLFITAALVMQILLTVGFTIWVVFPAMGRDYEAAVISAGFGGITLGSTATAIANMTAVAQQHGAAHRAFVIVPLVCGFFIDIVNALIISALVG